MATVPVPAPGMLKRAEVGGAPLVLVCPSTSANTEIELLIPFDTITLVPETATPNGPPQHPVLPGSIVANVVSVKPSVMPSGVKCKMAFAGIARRLTASATPTMVASKAERRPRMMAHLSFPTMSMDFTSTAKTAQLLDGSRQVMRQISKKQANQSLGEVLSALNLGLAAIPIVRGGSRRPHDEGWQEIVL